MSSGPCPDCFTGSIHTGTPQGTITSIHGLATYVAEPEDGTTPKGIVIMITDAFGLSFVNNRLLCDAYAKKGGFLVYCPDFMKGKEVSYHRLADMENITAPMNWSSPSSWLYAIFWKPVLVVKAISSFIPFLIQTRASVCRPRIVSFIQALRTSEPPFPTSDLKIGVAGFCWGGQHAINLCQDNPSTRVVPHSSQTNSSKPRSLIDCAFTAHPSFVNVPKDIESVTLPLSVAIGDADMAMKGTLVMQMKEILEKKKAGDHEVVVMPGATHGFAVRAVKMDDKQTEWADKAEKQAIDWFTNIFS